MYQFERKQYDMERWKLDENEKKSAREREKKEGARRIRIIDENLPILLLYT